MSEILEQQSEEREALDSIYDGDEAFRRDPSDPNTFQYKYGKEDDIKSFLVELKWGANYPNELPTINLDGFYNRNLMAPVKEAIKAALQTEGEQWLGCGMTYTLFECLKDRLDELTAHQPVCVESNLNSGVSAIKISDGADANAQKKEPKKECLTKAQKRRRWENTDHNGERARGWNWVDIIKHLSQTGGKEAANDAASSGAPIAQTLLQPLNS